MADSGFQHTRIPPQHLESEKALLGSIMLRPDVLYEMVDSLSPDAFYAEKHRRIYSAMMDLFSRHEPIDLLSLSTRMEEKKELEKQPETKEEPKEEVKKEVTEEVKEEAKAPEV